MVSKVTSSETILEDKPRSKAAPISVHKAFPAMVALWFAALFGFGSLVLPAALVERALATTHADAVLPVLASPLGIAGRALIALVALILGGVLGLVIARRIAQAQRPDLPEAGVVSPARAMRKKLRRAPADDEGRKPFSIRDALDDESDMPSAAEGADMPANGPAGRRRALAMQEDQKPRLAIPDVPLPGSHWPADDEEIAHEEFEEPQIEAADEQAEALVPLVESPPGFSNPDADTTPLVLETCALEAEDAERAPDAEPAEESALAARLAALTQSADDEQHDEPHEDIRAFDAPPHPAESNDARAFDAPPSAIEALRADDESDRFDASATSVEETPAPAPAPVPDHEPAAMPRPAIADRPLAELNVVELVERLACAISARNSGATARARVDAQPLDPALSHPFAVSQEVEATASEPPLPIAGDDDRPAPASHVPLALRPLVFEPLEECEDGQDDGESEALFSLPSFMPGHAIEARDPVPFKSAASDFGPPVEDEPEDETSDADRDDAEDDGMSEAYSSLLELRSGPAVTVNNGFVRVEEPEADELSLEPAVVFPCKKRESADSSVPSADWDGGSEEANVDEAASQEPAPGDLWDAATEPEPASEAGEHIEPDQSDAPENEPDTEAAFAASEQFEQEAPVARLFDAPPAAAEGEEKPFPPRDSGEMERALRAALANLQRMGGAG